MKCRLRLAFLETRFSRKTFLLAFNFRNANRKWTKHRQISNKNCFKRAPYSLSRPNNHISLISRWFRQFSKTLENVKFSNVLYRFPVCYIVLNSRAAISHWKLGSWHSEQEFCDFGLFWQKSAYVFRLIALWQVNAGKPIAMDRQICLLNKM